MTRAFFKLSVNLTFFNWKKISYCDEQGQVFVFQLFISVKNERVIIKL